jgi:hypothetical protein
MFTARMESPTLSGFGHHAHKPKRYIMPITRSMISTICIRTPSGIIGSPSQRDDSSDDFTEQTATGKAQ